MKKIAVVTPVSHLKGVNDLLESKGEVFYLEDNPSKDEVRELLLKNSINIIVCNPNQQSYKIDENLLRGTEVSIINSCSTGLNHIDLSYCEKNNIEIQCHKNDYELINELPSTSELAFGLMVSLLRSIPKFQHHVSNYGWDYTKFTGRQIKDLKIGIVGYGRLGKMMANYCNAFGADVRICDPYIDLNNEDSPIYPFYDLKDLFRDCDVISLHVHVTEETKHFITIDHISESNKPLYLINTSRGELVIENEVVQALEDNMLAGYGTDVIENEFDDLLESPIIKSMNKGENIIITPHIGGMTTEGQTKAYIWSISKI